MLNNRSILLFLFFNVVFCSDKIEQFLAYCNLNGDRNLKEGRIDEAIHCYDKIEHANSASKYSKLRNIASLFFRYNKVDLGMKYYDKVINFAPSDEIKVKISLHCFIELSKKDMINEAIRYGNQVLDLEKDLTQKSHYQVRFARSLIAHKRFKEALSYYIEAVKISEKFIEELVEESIKKDNFLLKETIYNEDKYAYIKKEIEKKEKIEELKKIVQKKMISRRFLLYLSPIIGVLSGYFLPNIFKKSPKLKMIKVVTSILGGISLMKGSIILNNLIAERQLKEGQKNIIEKVL